MGSLIDNHTTTCGLDLDKIDQTMSFFPSHQCTISCGTVCVDVQTSKLLVVFNKKLNIYQLPKGRKDIGEGLSAAAFRETYEETGVKAQPLPLKIPTRATKQRVNGSVVNRDASDLSNTPAEKIAAKGNPEPMEIEGTDEEADSLTAVDPAITVDTLHEEAVGVVVHPDSQADFPGTIKMIFFFAAQADSTAAAGPQALEEHEKLDAVWLPIADAGQKLQFSSERDVVARVRSLVWRTNTA